MTPVMQADRHKDRQLDRRGRQAASDARTVTDGRTHMRQTDRGTDRHQRYTVLSRLADIHEADRQT